MTAGDLARRLEVFERTVYRDISALGTAGVPVYAERGPGGGCMLMDGYRTNLTGLTGDEARTLFMAGTSRALTELGLGGALDAALLKVLAALPAAHRQEAERARQRLHLDPAGWNQSEEEVPHLRVIQEAVWRDRRLRLTHRRGGGEGVGRVVGPPGLVAQARGRCLVPLGGGASGVFRLAVALGGRLWWPTRGVTLETEEAARRSILGCGAEVEVREPLALREQIVRFATETAAFYAARAESAARDESVRRLAR